MKFTTSVGAIKAVNHGIVMTCKFSTATAYGDVVVIDVANSVVTEGMQTVKTLAGADSILVCGVCCTVGGVLAGGVGEVGMAGLFDVNTETATSNFAAGVALTNSATAGKAADGVETPLNLLGKVWFSPNNTTTQLTALIKCF